MQIIPEERTDQPQAAIPVDSQPFHSLTTDRLQPLIERNRQDVFREDSGPPVPYSAAMPAFLTAELRRRERGWGS